VTQRRIAWSQGRLQTMTAAKRQSDVKLADGSCSKWTERNRRPRLDFSAQSSYQRLRRRKKDQINHDWRGGDKRRLAGFPSQKPSTRPRCWTANHHEGSRTNTRQDSETQGRPLRASLHSSGRVLMRLGVLPFTPCPGPWGCR